MPIETQEQINYKYDLPAMLDLTISQLRRALIVAYNEATVDGLTPNWIVVDELIFNRLQDTRIAKLSAHILNFRETIICKKTEAFTDSRVSEWREKWKLNELRVSEIFTVRCSVEPAYDTKIINLLEIVRAAKSIKSDTNV